MSTTKQICVNQELTADWQLLGGEIGCDGYETITFWVDLTIEKSSELRLLTVAKSTLNNNGWYNMRPRDDLQAFYEIEKRGIVKILEDINQRFIITYELDGNIGFVKIFSCVATVGTTPATLSLKYSLI